MKYLLGFCVFAILTYGIISVITYTQNNTTGLTTAVGK